MRRLIIPQKMSNSGSIHDIASDQYDRIVYFRSPTKYVVILAAYYGDIHTTHSTEALAIQAAKRHGDYSLSIIDYDGVFYDIAYDFDGPCLVANPDIAEEIV